MRRVCTSARNDALLRGGAVLDGFRSLLQRPDEVLLIDLDAVLGQLEEIAPSELRPWAQALSARYRDI